MCSIAWATEPDLGLKKGGVIHVQLFEIQVGPWRGLFQCTAKAQIYRALPGKSVAEPFIAPGTGGINQVFGVFADDASDTLWACSNLVGNGPPGGPVGASSLHGFELSSGAAAAKGRHCS